MRETLASVSGVPSLAFAPNVFVFAPMPSCPGTPRCFSLGGRVGTRDVFGAKTKENSPVFGRRPYMQARPAGGGGEGGGSGRGAEGSLVCVFVCVCLSLSLSLSVCVCVCVSI